MLMPSTSCAPENVRTDVDDKEEEEEEIPATVPPPPPRRRNTSRQSGTSVAGSAKAEVGHNSVIFDHVLIVIVIGITKNRLE